MDSSFLNENLFDSIPNDVDVILKNIETIAMQLKNQASLHNCTICMNFDCPNNKNKKL